MKQMAQFIKDYIFPILASITFLFLLFIPAFAVDNAPIEAAPIAEAPVEAAPDAGAIDAGTPDAAATSSAATTSAPASTGGEFGEAGTSVSAPTTNSFAGAASFSIPIQVLPGRLGVAPSISLSYSSTGGNGFLGMGWNLDMGSIQRRTKDGLNYAVDDFIFSKGGSTSDLVYVSGTTVKQYTAKIEDGSFIKFIYNTTSKVWTALDKNGMVYTYGSASGSPQYSRLDDTTGQKIFKWALDKVTDTNGNYMTLSYYKDPTWRDLYLSQIDYTGNSSVSPALPTTNRIIFNRDSGTRPDVSTSYLTRFAVKTSYRLASIEVRANIDGTYQLSRKYVLNYLLSPGTNRSILSSVLLYGSDGATPMPQTVFTYQQGQLGLNTDEYWPGHIEPYPSGSGGFRLADVNGDGIADFVFDAAASGSGAYIKVLLGNGTDFETAQQWGYRLFPYDSQSKGFRLADMNGDGLPDYVYDNNGSIRVLLNTGNGFRTDDASAVWGVRTTGHYNNTGIRVADVNADGLPDVIYDNSKNIHILLNTGSSLLADAIWGSHTYHPGSSSGGFQMVDMNGDGKADYIYVDAKNVYVVLSTGTGFPTETFWGAKAKSYDNDCPGVKMADINGDGLPDLVYDGGGKDIRVLINNGSGFLTDISWGLRTQGYQTNSGCFQATDMNGDGLADFLYEDGNRNIRVLLNRGGFLLTDNSTAVWGVQLESFRDASPGLRIGDVDGDGIPDVVYDSDTNGNNVHVLRGKGPSPDLITNVNNGIGGTFTVAYTPSSTPLVRTHETLPFVLQTVSSITADDGLSEPTTTSYTYSGGFYDLEDREFRGFGYAKQTNPDNTSFETWHHQRDTGTWYWDGATWINWPNCYDTMADDDDFKGKPCHTELKDPNAVLLSTTDMQWSRGTTPLGTYPVFVRPSSKDVTATVGGVAVTSNEIYDYDPLIGTLKQVVTSGPDAEQITTDNLYLSFGTGGTYPIRTTKTTVTGSTTGKIRETTYGYQNVTGNMLWKEFWLYGGTNPRITMTYYTDGNLNTETDAKGNPPSSYTYDDATKTFPKTVTNALGFIRSNTYNYLYGKVDCAIDENLNKTCGTYDAFGRQTQAVSYIGAGPSIAAKTKTEYHDFEYKNTGLPNYIKKSVLETITGTTENYIDGYSFVDGFGRSIESITFGEAGKSIVSKTRYDNMGRAYHTEGPFFGTGTGYTQNAPAEYPWSQTAYNNFGKPVSIQSPDSDYGTVTSTIAYSGLSTIVTDPDGNSKKETKDYLGRVKQVVEYADAGAQTTNYVYNAAGDLLTVTDHNGNSTTMTYDTLGRKITMIDPDMGYWTYTYDPNGNLSTQTDAKGQTITFSYDAGNRVLSKTYSPVSSDNPTVTYTYDNLTISNGKGRPYSVNNTKATTVYNGYDALGRALSSTKTIQGDVTQYTTATVYDYSGKPTAMTYPDGYQVTNTYYLNSGLLYSVTGSDSKVYATNTLYEPTGKIGQITHQNGTATAYSYDPKSTRLTAIIATSPSSNGQPRNDLINRGYTYTHAGNISAITDYKKGNELGLPGDIFQYQYDYDRLHRFTNEATTNNVYNPVAYTYNAIGNILSKNVGSTSFAYTYDPIKKHAVNSIQINGGTTYNFGYDLNGNMTTGYDLTDLQNISARTIAYNADNMPVQVTHARYGTTNISYDGTSNRVKKISPSGAITYYVGEHFEVKNNEPIKYIFAGNLRVAKVAPTGTYFFHKDHLGSSAAMTNEVGSVQETSNYMPFGQMREYTGLDLSNYKFTDQEFDPETGLYYYGARYYDPTIGRFISADSVVQDPYDPQTLNRYTYCRNNPIIYTDPSGHIFGIDDLIVAAVAGAVLGGTTAAVTGGNVGLGMLTGAISGAIFFGAGELIASGNIINGCGEIIGNSFSKIAQAGIHAGAGAVSGGINSAIMGGNIGMGMLTGGVSAGLGEYAGGFLPNDFGSQFAGRSLIGGVTGGITSEMSGGDFGQGFTQGAATAASGFLFNHCMHGGCASLLEKVSNAAAGFGDTISMGGTRAVRNALNIDVVDYESGYYEGGKVAGYAWGAAAGGAVAARAAGYEVAFRAYPNAGGGGISLLENGKRIISADWHKFVLRGKEVFRPHIDIRGVVKHWPWK